MSPSFVIAIDDDPVNLHIIREIFEDAALEIVCSESGEQGLALLEDETSHFDIVILDRMMPGMDGLELLKRLKAIPRLSKLPVIMQTAAASPEQVAEGLRAGAYYYLTKPYAPESLRAIVRAALQEDLTRRDLETREQCSVATLGLLSTASFSYRTLAEAATLATQLSAYCPEPGAIRLGLAELMVNAVEHGNLGIGYGDKTRLVRQNRWRREVERRLNLPQYRELKVTVAFERRPDELCFTITDCGQGFDWKPYFELDPKRAFDPNGRGIATARGMNFQCIEYLGTGNAVRVRVRDPR